MGELLPIPLLPSDDYVEKGKRGCSSTVPPMLVLPSDECDKFTYAEEKRELDEPLKEVIPAKRRFAEHRTLKEHSTGIAFEEPRIVRPLDVRKDYPISRSIGPKKLAVLVDDDSREREQLRVRGLGIAQGDRGEVGPAPGNLVEALQLSGHRLDGLNCHIIESITRIRVDDDRLPRRVLRGRPFRPLAVKVDHEPQLHSLRQVIERHFEEEQEACFSILKTELGPDEARDLLKAMERATTEIRSLYE